MPTERPSFLDRVNSAQQTINRGYQNEEQTKLAEAKRDLGEIGVILAFQDLIKSGTIVAEKGSDKPVYIEYEGDKYYAGCYLVINDKYSYRPDDGEYCPDNIFFKRAIGVVKDTSSTYRIGLFSSETHNGVGAGYSDLGVPIMDIHTKRVQRNEVLSTLATVVVIYNHNKKEAEGKTYNYIKFP